MWTGSGVSVGTSMASTTDGSPHPSVKNRSRSGPLLTIVPPRRSMGWITPPTPSECRGETLFDHAGGRSHLVEYRAESKDECRGNHVLVPIERWDEHRSMSFESHHRVRRPLSNEIGMQHGTVCRIWTSASAPQEQHVSSSAKQTPQLPWAAGTCPFSEPRASWRCSKRPPSTPSRHRLVKGRPRLARGLRSTTSRRLSSVLRLTRPPRSWL